jgi:hypothetical protein
LHDTQFRGPRRTRSIVNLAMLGALNRPHEMKLQVAVYGGIPSEIDAFRNAREAFREVVTAEALAELDTMSIMRCGNLPNIRRHPGWRYAVPIQAIDRKLRGVAAYHKDRLRRHGPFFSIQKN